MTRKELCDKYDVPEQSLKNNFGRVKASLLRRYNIILTKTGRGDNVDYQVEFGGDKRALTMMKEQKREVMINEKSFSTLLDFNFMVFLAICTTPMGTFYGSYDDFLDYVEVKRSKYNITNLKNALSALAAAHYIRYEEDETNPEYFNAYLFYETRQNMAISLDMAERCQKLADKYKKRSWIPLLKTWIGVQYMYDKQPFTMQELCDITGLSEYQLRESKKILEKDELFVTSKAYVSYDRCIGSNVELNGIYEENRKIAEKLI